MTPVTPLPRYSRVEIHFLDYKLDICAGYFNKMHPISSLDFDKLSILTFQIFLSYDSCYRVYGVRENMENNENIERSGKNEKNAQVREKSGKFIFSQFSG